MTYRALYDVGVQRLTQALDADAALDARRLLEHACGTDRHTLYAAPEREISEKEQALFFSLLERRKRREPTAYILGTCDFMGLSFFCDARALIPSPDTEFVTEEALTHLHDEMTFLDLCTGTGCIALSLAALTNGTRGVATDLSPDALALAEKNRAALGQERVRFLRCDLFPEEGGSFDLIVSNPPYIRTDVIDTLQPEVAVHEPRMALDGGADGLIFYRRILSGAPAYLNRGGWLVLETGYDQGDAVLALMKAAGFRHVEKLRDYGGNDRVVKGCYY